MQGEDLTVVDNFNMNSETNLKSELIKQYWFHWQNQTQDKPIKYCVQRGNELL